ncbi:MAG: zf-HC2 domain-containing protein [Bacillota bacterium]
MGCEKARELLSPYLDGELEPSEKKFLSGHLEMCPACRSELAELQAAVQIFRRLPQLAPAPTFRARLRERLVREDLSRPAGERPGAAAISGRDPTLRPAPRLSGAANENGRAAGGLAPSRRAGPRAAFSAFLSGAGIWPRLAVAATLLLAVGIASLWYGLAGPGLYSGAPPAPLGQIAASPAQKEKGSPGRQAGAEAVLGAEKRKSHELIAGGYAKPAVPQQSVPVKTGQGEEPLRASAPARPLAAEAKDSWKAEQPDQARETAGSVRSSAKQSSKNAVVPPEPAAAAPEQPSAAGGEISLTDKSTGEEVLMLFSESTPPPQKVIRRMEIAVKGGDVQKLTLLLARFAAAGEEAAAAGPAGAGSNGDDQKPGVKNPLTGKIEISRLPEFIAQIKTLGTILKQEEKEQDVTADYLKLAEELKQKQLKEEEMAKIMLAEHKNNRSTRNPDSPFQQELAGLQAEIQSLKEQLQKIAEELQLVSVEIYWQE